MTKTSRDPASASEAAFHKHYATIWGEERWNSTLFPALTAPTRQVALINSYAPETLFQNTIAKQSRVSQLEEIRFPSISGDEMRKCYALNAETALDTSKSTDGEIGLPQPEIQRIGTSGFTAMSHWNLDAASVLAAHMLDVQPSEDVLDLCAAPGGKSVALAQSMWPHSVDTKGPTAPAKVGRLISNEANKQRHRRLAENLKAYLPAQLLQSKQMMSLNIDATDPMAPRQLLLGSAGYDKVLVDAPCSSERHIIHAHLAAKASNRAAPEMTNWRPGSSSKLAKTQLDLLMTALQCVRVGGSVLYATCSIEPIENDGVVEKVVAAIEKEVRRGKKWSVRVGFSYTQGEKAFEEILEREWAERTKYGWIVLPDHPSGGRWGPLFFAMLTKVGVDKP